MNTAPPFKNKYYEDATCSSIASLSLPAISAFLNLILKSLGSVPSNPMNVKNAFSCLMFSEGKMVKFCEAARLNEVCQRDVEIAPLLQSIPTHAKTHDLHLPIGVASAQDPDLARVLALFQFDDRYPVLYELLLRALVPISILRRYLVVLPQLRSGFMQGLFVLFSRTALEQSIVTLFL